ncbi:MAG: putative Brix domain-containing ribosomal biogenesis protein [Methanosaeta sp. PtaU1.Bin112]|nr:MAG: putative Brix domain-containing ribosomal biogenesis protein [Methanosaeta sp. PtaU1.Bin112]
MLVTTSRDPSSKARRFARALASFLSLPYVNRGKQNLEEDETWLIVIEDHGNPAGLIKRAGDQTEQMSFQLSGDPEGRRLKRCVPKVAGEEMAATAIAKFFELEWHGSIAPARGRIIWVAPNALEFVDEGLAKFRLKI